MKKEVKSFFNRHPNQTYRSKDIFKKIGLTNNYDYAALKQLLYQLFEENYLMRIGKRYKLNSTRASNRIAGVLQINKGGYGFVIPIDKSLGDIFIAARNLSTAFSGDSVEVLLFAKQKGRNLEGQVARIIKRKRTEIIGTLEKSKSFFFIKPDEPDIHRDIYISRKNLSGAKAGDKVVVGHIDWSSQELNPEGKVIEVLGKSGTHDAELAALAKEFGLRYVFSKKINLEAEHISGKIEKTEIKSRLDLRGLTAFTIDPVDAKDFDDALSIEELGNGNLSVGIHIADVSHYVVQSSELDKEALQRGNSVYFVGKVIPMLPEKLSNLICSLVPDEDRLTYSVLVEVTPRGRIVNYNISKSVIRSKRRFTYDEVQQIIENNTGEFVHEITLLNSLAQTIRAKRMKDGSIDFISPEVKFELDANGKPLKIVLKQVMQSNMLVEEFMLLANKIVAKHINRSKPFKGMPFVYRIHDLPDQERLVEFAKFVKSLGYSFDPDSSSKPRQFQQLLSSVKGTEEEALINDLAIRSMAKAVYSTDNIGHYGLGFKFYTHFTSPIRRYSDLMVHRLLYHYLNSNLKPLISKNRLEEICDHISFCERNAIDAERFSVKLKQIEYLNNHIGEIFEGIISGVVPFGLFVRINDILAEGLVHIKDLEGDFYIYDEKKYAIYGRRSQRRFRLGDKIKIKLIRVDFDKSELDFAIADEQQII